MPKTDTDHLPRLVLTDWSDSLPGLLLDIQHLLIRYPQAARGLIQVFVSEGRQFAATPEGKAWKKRLAKSQLVRRGRFIWDAYSLDALLENETGRLPSAWLDVILAAVVKPELETILSNLIVDEIRNGTLSAS